MVAKPAAATSTKNSISSVSANPRDKISMFVDDEEEDELLTFECDNCWFTTRDAKELTNHLIDKHGYLVEAANVIITF